MSLSNVERKVRNRCLFIIGFHPKRPERRVIHPCVNGRSSILYENSLLFFLQLLVLPNIKHLFRIIKGAIS